MATLIPFVFTQFFDNNGNPLNGGKVYTYEAGTTTPKTTFTDSTGDTQNANPVILDSAGRAAIWLGDGGYKFILKTSADVTVGGTFDNIGGVASTAFAGNTQEISSNTTVDATLANSAFIATAALTLSLLDVATAGESFYFSVYAPGGDVTIDPDTTETINNASTLVIPQGSSAIISCDGDEWWTIAASSPSFSGNNSFTGNNTFTGKVLYPDDGELTIASGAITVTGTYHTVDTQTDAASDDLDTINGGSDGQILILQTENSSRDVVITQAGNIVTPYAVSFTLGTANNAATLIYSGALTKWVVVSAPQASATFAQGATADTALQPSFLHIQDQKSAGTQGGGSTSGSWQTKTLNTEVTDTIGSTLSSNEFTLPVGTYEIDAISPACSSNAHQARLYNVTDAAVALYGTSEFSSSGSQIITQSHITGRITIADTKTFRIEHRVTASRATDGYGAANNFGGTEIYTDVRVYKV